MADALTGRQREVLELFVTAIRECRPAPTFREVCAALDLVSTNTANDHMRALVRKGWLEVGPKGAARSRMLTNKARLLYGLPLPRRAA